MTPPIDSAPMTDAADERALNDRRAAILEAVVTEYIGTAEPVGSSHVANAPGVQVSSATVRSEMVALEREGYLVQPHTSAGPDPDRQGVPLLRRPPDRARRPRPLPAQAGVAVLRAGPRRDGDRARAGLGPALRADLVRRRRGGAVARHRHHPLRPARRALPAPRAARRSALRRCRREADHRPRRRDRRGRAGPRRHPALRPSGRAQRSRSPGPSRPAVRSRSTSSCSRRAWPSTRSRGPWRPTRCSSVVRPDWPSPSTPSRRCVRSSPSWSSSSSSSPCCATFSTAGLSVAIGTEHGFEPLSSCAVVVAPVSIDGQDLGAVGLLGPTRMDYARAMAAAHVVGERLGQRISGGHDGRH